MIEKKCKIILLTIGDLGDIKNTKTKNTKPVIDAIEKMGVNYHIYCRDFVNYKNNKISKVLIFGRFFPRVFEFLSIIFPFFSGRRVYLFFMDYIMSKKNLSNYDVLITIPMSFPLTCKKFKKNNGIILVNEDSAHNNSFFFNKYDKKNPFIKIKEEVLKNTDFVYTYSEFAKKSYIDNNWNEDRVYMTPTGTDVNKFKPGKKKDNIFRVIAVANYNERKGFKYLLKAWDELKLKNSELIIIGNPVGNMKKLIIDYKKKILNLKQINFTNDIEKYYNQSSVFVLPSLLEGSARVIYEAMSAELPIICTYESGSVVRDGIDGFIVPVENVEAIKNKILYFYNNPSKIKEMGMMGRKLIIENYKWDDFSNRIYDVIKDICEKEKLL